MKQNLTMLYRILAVSLGLVIALGSLSWLPGAAAPAAAQSPETADLTLKVFQTQEGLGIAAIGSTPTFDVGDIFTISIVAQGVTEPGIFGSQFELQFDPVHVQAVEGSLLSGVAMEPVVIGLSEIDNVAGLVRYAASRRGDIENLTGDVVLATLSLEAISPTEPPEGQTTTLSLQNVKLGAKGGIEVPVSGLVNLSIIIRAPDGAGDIVGNVTVEGRAADNQAGHTVTAAGDLGGVLADTTDPVGDFLIDNAPADTYTMTADRPGFLAATCQDVVHTTAALTTLLPVQLLAGDIDGNGEIDITDAVAIGGVFGSTTPGEVADLDDSGEVDVLDLILMAANFAQTSAGNPWLCQSVEL
jgi:hypothetical protein